MRTNYFALASCLALACSVGPFAGEGGGADNLPSLGAGPYRLLPADFDTSADEPYVVAKPIVSLLDPAVIATDNGAFEIYFAQIDDVQSEIWRVELASIYELLQDTPEQVLVADSAWEEGQVGAPCVVVDGDTTILYYQGGSDTPAIGRAVSTDGGRSFTKDPGNPIVSQGRDPYVSRHGEQWFMVYADLAEQKILMRESSEGQDFSEARELITARSGQEEAFDSQGLRSPALSVRDTLDGGMHFGLFYTGLSLNLDGELVEAIGYQGSFDTEHWERYLAGEPILDAGPAGAGGPAPVIGTSSAHLFFHQRRQSRGRIAVAVP